jgi:transketolase
MSKLKSPREKKLASLALDRRNVYGENDKASRKNIPKTKQQKKQALRRAANQPLQALRGSFNEESASAAELTARDQVIEKKRKLFRKRPDAPLGVVLDARDNNSWVNAVTENWIGNPKPR